MSLTSTKLIWLWISPTDLKTELEQLQDEGRDVSKVKAEFTRLASLSENALYLPANQTKAEALLARAQKLPLRKDYPFTELSDLKGIFKLRPKTAAFPRKPLSDASLKDRIFGAWLGRCCGCLLGKGSEGMSTDRLWPFLKKTGQWPLSRYIRYGVKGKLKKEFADLHFRAYCDDCRYMPVDDDINYTVSGLLILEKNGADFTPADMANFWLFNIPLGSVCTAERIAYRNFLNRIDPPYSAVLNNPYREWIGAQIRGDAFGYVNLGNPARAAEFAWRDASISHIKNGIYGEMFVAAMLAAAPWCESAGEVIEAGLSQVPANCRLSYYVKKATEWHLSGMSYDNAVKEIHTIWKQGNSHHWCHTISNAVICVTALLYGEGDFGMSICRAVHPCFDTDCNGATVGSIVGMMLGAKKMPSKWTSRLNNTAHTSLQGNNVLKIDELAGRTFTVYKKIKAG